MHLLEGVIVGRRSMGRKLAFADIALNPSTVASFAPTSSTSNYDSSATDRRGCDSLGTSGSINVIFFRQNFLGPSGLQNNDTSLDEPFPTKMTSLPYGACVIIQLGICQKVPSKDGSGRIEDVWEVSRWKMKEHPRELAEQLASLEGSSLSMEVSSVSLKKEPQQQNPGVIMGSGALSCSTYLKARRETFVSAKQRIRRQSDIKGSGADLTDIGEDASNTVTNEVGKNRSMTTIPAKTMGALPAAKANSLNSSENIIDSDFHHGGKQAKAKRAKIFASWVLDTFFGLPMGTAGDGMDQMICQPCFSKSNAETDAINPSHKNVHVLDIAGGKGQLSLELYGQQMSYLSSPLPWIDEKKDDEKDLGQLNHPLVSPPISQCTIIDPLVRKGDSKQWHSKLKRARSHANWLRGQTRNTNEHEDDSLYNDSCHANSNLNTDNDAPCNREKKKPSDDDTSSAIEHLAMCFNATSFPELYSRCKSQSDDATLLPSSEQSPCFPFPEHKNELSTLLLLGLHPDQCTEDILDVALKYNLPFAIVPCCVFPDLFPSRKMLPRKKGSENTNDTKESTHNESNVDAESNYPNCIQSEGNHDANLVVRSYEDFLQYLMDKDDGLQMATLPFEGKNTVIYKIVS